MALAVVGLIKLLTPLELELLRAVVVLGVVCGFVTLALTIKALRADCERDEPIFV